MPIVANQVLMETRDRMETEDQLDHQVPKEGLANVGKTDRVVLQVQPLYFLD